MLSRSRPAGSWLFATPPHVVVITCWLGPRPSPNLGWVDVCLPIHLQHWGLSSRVRVRVRVRVPARLANATWLSQQLYSKVDMYTSSSLTYLT